VEPKELFPEFGDAIAVALPVFVSRNNIHGIVSALENEFDEEFDEESGEESGEESA
jgi:hypothetical protein